MIEQISAARAEAETRIARAIDLADLKSLDQEILGKKGFGLGSGH